jgi:hypothetical protein
LLVGTAKKICGLLRLGTTLSQHKMNEATGGISSNKSGALLVIMMKYWKYRAK